MHVLCKMNKASLFPLICFPRLSFKIIVIVILNNFDPAVAVIKKKSVLKYLYLIERLLRKHLLLFRKKNTASLAAWLANLMYLYMYICCGFVY